MANGQSISAAGVLVARLLGPDAPGEQRQIIVVAPRLLSLGEAARYCGVSATHFEKHCPMRPIKIGQRRLWDVKGLDAWIDILGGGGTPVRPDDDPMDAILALRRARKQKRKAGPK
jgi:hypothetical protein